MGMGEKNNHTQSSFGFFSRKPLLCLFSFTSILFTLSWFFVLRSAGRPTRIIDHSFLLPNTKVHSTIDTSQSKNQNEAKPSFTNRSILVDDDNEEESSASKSNRRDSALKCNSSNVVLKVFMYDLPSEFHFELLDWKAEGGESSVWPDIRTKIPHYPGGLNLQHSIEYWLTLDLLSSEFDKSSPRSAVRVHNSSEADVIFVPFFSSLCYNRYSKVNPHQKRSKNKLLQEKLVRYLTAQEEWKRSGGRDHIVMAHHPNSMLDARMKLWPATFILSDFGRYPPNIANVEKDVIVPYKHVIRSYVNDASDFDSRTTLLYFQGAIYRKDGGFVRQELFYLLKDEKDVHFSFGSVQKDGISKATQGMHSSKFCLNIAGDTPSSNRLFDAIASHCVPVIISDEIELPYEDVLDYSKFCIFVRASDAVKDLAGNTPSSNRLFDVITSHCIPVIISDEIELPYEDVLDYSKFCIFVRTSDAEKEKFLIKLIRSIGKDEWTQMWKRLKEVKNFFKYKYPSREGDALQMIWQAVARKVPAIHLKLHKARRFTHTPQAHRDRWLNKIPTPSNFR